MTEAKLRDAILSEDKRFRYLLLRVWDTDLPMLGWLLLNPSTADAENDDQTVRKCAGFGKRLGFGGILNGNVYALRARDPDELKKAKARGEDLQGENVPHLRFMARTCPTIIVGWGGKVLSSLDAKHAIEAIAECPNILCLGKTNDGAPRHHCYLSYSTTPEPWR